jgi:hypothetical protein
MRLTLRDLIATIVVAAIAVPYVGYLIDGEMPFVEDPRGMSGVGLLLGVVAFLVLGFDTTGRLGKVGLGFAALSVVLGFVSLGLAETGAAEVLLAVFMGSILLVWLFELMDHAGLLPGDIHPSGLKHS